MARTPRQTATAESPTQVEPHVDTYEWTSAEKLLRVQAELKAPKGQYNSFGKYAYRNQEDILEAVKPLLMKYNLPVRVSDSIYEGNGWMAICATVIVGTGTDCVEVKAYAGVDFNRKGMDIAQAFGASSSYARKYALNGMFLIDDTKDADATNMHGKGQALPPSPVKQVTPTTPAPTPTPAPVSAEDKYAQVWNYLKAAKPEDRESLTKKAIEKYGSIFTQEQITELWNLQ
jgi:hypothetical protein